MASKASKVTKIHRFLDLKNGYIHSYLMSTECSEYSLASFLAEDLSLTDEQYNELLHMLAKAKFQTFRLIDDFHGFCISDEFGPILAGAGCKRELSEPGNRIPDENRNPANNADDGQGEIGDPVDDVGAQAGNNNQDEAADMEVDVGGGDGGGDGGGGGGGNNDPVPPIVIYRYQLNGQGMQINFAEEIETDITADNCQSWGDLGEYILTIWRQKHPGDNPPIAGDVTPANCWPRAETIFGFYYHGQFQSMNWAITEDLDEFIFTISDLLVIENVNGFDANGVPHVESDSEDDNNVVNTDGQIRTYLYNFRHDEMEMTLESQFTVHSGNGAAFESWDHVARECYREYLVRNGFEPAEVDVDIPACWPGADTIFGCRVGSRFQSLNWPYHAWADVGPQINCLLLILFQD